MTKINYHTPVLLKESIDALVIDEGSKSRKLFEILESKNLIKSVSRTEV